MMSVMVIRNKRKVIFSMTNRLFACGEVVMKSTNTMKPVPAPHNPERNVFGPVVVKASLISENSI